VLLLAIFLGPCLAGISLCFGANNCSEILEGDFGFEPMQKLQKFCKNVSPKNHLELDYYPKRQIESAICASDRTPDGPYLFWYENGMTESCGANKMGKLDGRIIRWYANGVKRDDVIWVLGQPNGPFTIWNENGAVLDRGEYRNGLPLYAVSKWAYSVSLGVSSGTYTEAEHRYDSISLVPKITLNFRPFQKIDFSANVFGTVHAFSRRAQPQENTTVKFYGLNFRAGTPFWRTPSLRVLLSAGIYFSGMQVTGNQFGYKTALAQVYPSVDYRLNQKLGFSGYFKFAPLMRGSFDLSKNETALGLSLNRSIKEQHKLILSLDLSQLKTTTSAEIRISSRQMTLGVGYAF